MTREDFAARIDRLAALEDGWLDGDGVALSEGPLRLFASVALLAHGMRGMPLPFMCPLVDGNLTLEWDKPDTEAELDLATMVIDWWDDDDPAGRDALRDVINEAMAIIAGQTS